VVFQESVNKRFFSTVWHSRRSCDRVKCFTRRGVSDGDWWSMLLCGHEHRSDMDGSSKYFFRCVDYLREHDNERAHALGLDDRDAVAFTNVYALVIYD
jgi:hypothetical protein